MNLISIIIYTQIYIYIYGGLSIYDPRNQGSGFPRSFFPRLGTAQKERHGADEPMVFIEPLGCGWGGSRAVSRKTSTGNIYPLVI